MDKERMLKVAEVIEDYEDHFNMDVWFRNTRVDAWDTVRDLVSATDMDSCGTTACVAGWACYLWKDEIDRSETSFRNAGAAILDLDNSEARTLFGMVDHDAHEIAELIRNVVNGFVDLNDLYDEEDGDY